MRFSRIFNSITYYRNRVNFLQNVYNNDIKHMIHLLDFAKENLYCVKEKQISVEDGKKHNENFKELLKRIIYDSMAAEDLYKKIVKQFFFLNKQEKRRLIVELSIIIENYSEFEEDLMYIYKYYKNVLSMEEKQLYYAQIGEIILK